MGVGCNTAYMMLDSRTKICLGLLPDGTMTGLPQILFDCENFYSIEATSYCSASSLSLERLNEVFDKHMNLRVSLRNFVFRNPYD